MPKRTSTRRAHVTKRRPVKKRHGRRTPTTSVVVPSQSLLFPDQYRAQGVISDIIITSASSDLRATYRGNSVYLHGPQLGYSGSFAASTPSGMNYLLASNSASGAAAPYGYATVTSATFEVRLAANSSSNTGAFTLGVTGSLAASLSGTTQQQLREQKWTKFVDVPAYTTGRAIILRHRFNFAEMFGLTYREYLEQYTVYGGTATSVPTKIAYIQLWLVANDGTTGGSYSLDVTMRSNYVLSQLNVFNSTTPTLLRELKANTTATDQTDYINVEPEIQTPTPTAIRLACTSVQPVTATIVNTPGRWFQ